MTELKELGKQFAARMGAVPDECAVKGCPNDHEEVVELEPFDPIDNSSTLLQLCAQHLEWADERNAFAEMIYGELAQRRAELGEEHLEEIKRLETPHAWEDGGGAIEIEGGDPA